jgi:hypothetical protein
MQVVTCGHSVKSTTLTTGRGTADDLKCLRNGLQFLISAKKVGRDKTKRNVDDRSWRLGRTYDANERQQCELSSVLLGEKTGH